MRQLLLSVLLLDLGAATVWSQGYPAQVAAEKMTVAPGLEVRLVASEPLVRQPVAIEFDDRGRLWVIQYLQYPNPAGLNRVEVDRYSRTRYDRIPEPPPKGPKGSDRITILEDTNGDGVMDRSKDFVSGLNLASSIAFGRGGVYVLQAPYLLFYRDLDRDDVPDGDPEVLVTGFGMEDAHSVANSLTWGPDGWLYGLQGSTVTAKIQGGEFQQGVWRFHPVTRKFELFAEGGGNMWGLDFDRDGELLASTNVGGNIMLHFVRGAYYWKQFGKHGALHNPYAFGYFDHVKHTGIKGGHVAVGGLFYEAATFPAEWRGRYIAADLLEHGIRWHEVKPLGSTFQARQGGDVLLANDTWFAPSDQTLGPDGCLYVTDWNDKRTAHPDPDAEWDRSNGRIYRLQPKGFRAAVSLDLDELSSKELVERLASSNAWQVRRARRILSERQDKTVSDELIGLINTCGGKVPCVEALWALHGVGGLNASLARDWLSHPDPAVRGAVVRLIGEHPEWAGVLRAELVARSVSESSARVRSHLAGLAAWVDPLTTEKVLDQLMRREEDRDDPMIPLRIWWSIEYQIRIADAEHRFSLFRHWSPEARASTIWLREVEPRLLRRDAAYPDSRGVRVALSHVEGLQDRERRNRLIEAIEEATRGRGASVDRAELARFRQAVPDWQASVAAVRFLARQGDVAAKEEVLTMAQNAQTSEPVRALMIETWGETDPDQAMGVLLKLATSPSVASPVLRSAALQALGRVDSPTVAEALLASYRDRDSVTRKQYRGVLIGRAGWSLSLLRQVDAGQIPSADFSTEEVRRLALHRAGAEGGEINRLILKHWGKLTPATPEAKLAEVRRLSNDLRAGVGDRERGKSLFKEHCAGCHQLFGEGAKIGPELTHANRKDRDFLLVSLVAPSDVVRREFRSVTIHLRDGRVESGLVGEQSDTQVTLIKSATDRIIVRRSEIEEMVDSSTSLMPEDLYRKFNPEALRDLFRYLQSDGKQ